MRKKKFKHARRPFWRIRWRPNARHWVPASSDGFKTFGEAMVDFLAWQDKRSDYTVALYRVQPLVCGEPGWCSHNEEHMEFLMGDRNV